MNGGSTVDRLFDARRSPLLGPLRLDELSELTGRCQLVRASRGPIHHRSDAVVVSVLEGVAVATCFAPGGDHIVAALLGPGASWGLPEALGHHGPAVELHALAEVTLLVVAGGDLRHLVAHHPGIAHACLMATARDLAAQHWEAVTLAHASTFQRVVHRLIELTTRWGEPDGTNGDRIHVTIPMTQEDLAAWARVSRESAAKALAHLRAAGILETGRRHLTILDLPRLRERDPQERPDPDLRRLLHVIT